MLTLFLYIHHKGSVVFLSCRDIVATDAVNIVELTHAEFTCHVLVTDEVILGKVILCHSDNRSGINRVIFRLVTLQCKSAIANG